MKFFFTLALGFFLFSHNVYADYILPYPGPMPGNNLYKIVSLVDLFQQYWNWGSIAKIKYYESLADKNLVEMKTLWEYKQYLLGTVALNRSNENINKIVPYMKKAFLEGKDINQYVKIFAEENAKHVEILSQLKNQLPQSFDWTPENESSKVLNLHEMIDAAILVRKNAINEVASFSYCTQMVSSIKTKQELFAMCSDAKMFVTEYMYQEMLK